MNTEEVPDGTNGNIMIGGSQGGQFECTDGDDYWAWRGTPFPSTGWDLDLTSGGSISGVDYVFTSYAFDTDTEIPESKFGGNTFVIKKNGVTIGWLEAYVSGSNQAKLMWWSNGQSLTRDRYFDVSAGDTLSFVPGPFPTNKQYPLNHYQG